MSQHYQVTLLHLISHVSHSQFPIQKKLSPSVNGEVVLWEKSHKRRNPTVELLYIRTYFPGWKTERLSSNPWRLVILTFTYGGLNRIPRESTLFIFLKVGIDSSSISLTLTSKKSEMTHTHTLRQVWSISANTVNWDIF